MAMAIEISIIFFEISLIDDAFQILRKLEEEERR